MRLVHLDVKAVDTPCEHSCTRCSKRRNSLQSSVQGKAHSRKFSIVPSDVIISRIEERLEQLKMPAVVAAMDFKEIHFMDNSRLIDSPNQE